MTHFKPGCWNKTRGQLITFFLVMMLVFISTSDAFAHDMSPIFYVLPFLVGMRLGIWALLIGSHAIRYPTRLMAKFTPSFGIAFFCSFLSLFVAYGIGFFLPKGFYLGFVEDFPLPPKQNTPVGALAVWFLLCSVIFAFLIRSPARKALGVPKGLIIGAIQVLALLVALRVLTLIAG